MEQVTVTKVNKSIKIKLFRILIMLQSTGRRGKTIGCGVPDQNYKPNFETNVKTTYYITFTLADKT